jgi:hypothetical protein
MHRTLCPQLIFRQQQYRAALRRWRIKQLHSQRVSCRLTEPLEPEVLVS